MSVHRTVGAGTDPTFLLLSDGLQNTSLRELWLGRAAAEEMSPQPSREQLEVITN